MRKLILFSIVCFILGVGFSSCSYSQRKANSILKQAQVKESYDVIIVPGFPHDSTTGWDRATKGRIVWATYLYSSGITKNIIFSGSAVYTPYIEAKVMAEYGKVYGVPDSAIFLETKAEHSTENVFYSYHLAKRLGFDRVALATDPFQAKMLARFIKKRLDGKVDILPFSIDVLKTQEQPDPVLNVDSLLIDDFVPISERESFWTRFAGTRGKHIDYDAFPAP